MAYLPNGSDLFRTVMNEIDSKYIDSMPWKTVSDNSDDRLKDSSANIILNRNRKCSHRHENEKRENNRVQWVDECEVMPLFCDNRQEGIRKSEGKLKSILKQKINCLIIVSEKS